MAIDRTKVSFAEAEGQPRFPSILNWGALDDRLRSAIWTPFYLLFDDHIDRQNKGYCFVDPVGAILIKEYVFRQHKFISDFPEYERIRDRLIDRWSSYFKAKDYIELFDFVTFFLRDENCPLSLLTQVARALDQPFSPYRLEVNTRTIIPVLPEEQSATLETDLTRVFKTPFAGAKIHMQKALDALNQGDHRTVVREAINAVESAVRDFTKDPNAVLSRALRKLVEEQGMHRAMIRRV